MEIGEHQVGPRTEKAFNFIPPGGLLSGNDGSRIPLSGNIDSIKNRLQIFYNGEDGIARIPKGKKDGILLREAVIKDTIEEAKNDKFSSSLDCLNKLTSNISNQSEKVRLFFDPESGRIVDLDSTNDQTVKLTSLKSFEVSISNNCQITDVYFESDPSEKRDTKGIISGGLTRSQIKVMAAVAGHNRKLYVSSDISEVVFEPKIKIDKEYYSLDKFGEFWKAFASI